MATAPTEAEVYRKSVNWRETDDVDFPFEAEVDGMRWRLRLNDFPIEPLLTLFIDDREWGTFDDWPPSWVRP